MQPEAIDYTKNQPESSCSPSSSEQRSLHEELRTSLHVNEERVHLEPTETGARRHRVTGYEVSKPSEVVTIGETFPKESASLGGSWAGLDRGSRLAPSAPFFKTGLLGCDWHAVFVAGAACYALTKVNEPSVKTGWSERLWRSASETQKRTLRGWFQKIIAEIVAACAVRARTLIFALHESLRRSPPLSRANERTHCSVGRLNACELWCYAKIPPHR